MSTCPCCSDSLLRHIRHGAVYWFCRSCWAEMPNFEEYSRASVASPAKIKPTFVSTIQPRRIAGSQEQLTLVKYPLIHPKQNSEGIAA